MTDASPSSQVEARRTRHSLISRLRDLDDQVSWQEFFETYWRLIFSVARRAGLTEDEAEEVVQETVIAVAKYIPGFRYDPAVCSFKNWLMHKTQWRIIDQVRKRPPDYRHRVADSKDSPGTALLDAIPDPESLRLESVWDEEWRRNIVDVAMGRVKHRIKPEHYQIFYLSAVRGLTPGRVAGTIGVSLAQVYLVRHRVAAQITSEVRRLEERARGLGRDVGAQVP